jgi:hypothetical protein
MADVLTFPARAAEPWPVMLLKLEKARTENHYCVTVIDPYFPGVEHNTWHSHSDMLEVVEKMADVAKVRHLSFDVQNTNGEVLEVQRNGRYE